VTFSEARHDRGVVADLGSGTEVWVLEVARGVADRFAGDVRLEHRPARVGDVAGSSADLSGGRHLFGYTPRAALEVGFDRTVAWFRSGGA